MAITARTNTAYARFLLNNGTDAQGNVKTIAMRVPNTVAGLSAQNTTQMTSLMAVAEAMSPLMSKSIYGVQVVETSDIID